MNQLLDVLQCLTEEYIPVDCHIALQRQTPHSKTLVGRMESTNDRGGGGGGGGGDIASIFITVESNRRSSKA